MRVEETTHLGDGVYLSFDGYQLWLAANHHENRVIALEPGVFKNLIDAGTAIFQRAAQAPQKTQGDET